MTATVLALALAARAAAEPAAATTEARPLMGTLVSITVVGASSRTARAGVEVAFAALDRVDRVMSEWRAESPLSELNRAAGSGRWTSLPADLCLVLRFALEGSRRTAGLFDPTWAALRDLWRFDQASPVVPSDAALQERCTLVDYRKLELDPARGSAACRARLAEAGMQVGLGGVAKGWAVDQAVRALRSAGLRNFVVQAGGDLYAAGSNRGRPWKISIRDPRGAPDEAFASLAVRDQALSTSGDYENFFVAGGVRYHHLVDPRTCRPATASRSASVLARSAVEAEILSKAAFILGGAAALDLVAGWSAAAVLVDAEGRLVVSPALAHRLGGRTPRPRSARALAGRRPPAGTGRHRRARRASPAAASPPGARARRGPSLPPTGRRRS